MIEYLTAVFATRMSLTHREYDVSPREAAVRLTARCFDEADADHDNQLR